MKGRSLPFPFRPADAVLPGGLAILAALGVLLGGALRPVDRGGTSIVIVPDRAPGALAFARTLLGVDGTHSLPWTPAATRRLMERAIGAPLPPDAPLPAILETRRPPGVTAGVVRRRLAATGAAIVADDRGTGGDRRGWLAVLAGCAALAATGGALEGRRIVTDRRQLLRLLASLGASPAQAAGLAGARALLAIPVGAGLGSAAGVAVALLGGGSALAFWPAGLAIAASVALGALLAGVGVGALDWREAAR